MLLIFSLMIRVVKICYFKPFLGFLYKCSFKTTTFFKLPKTYNMIFICYLWIVTTFYNQTVISFKTTLPLLFPQPLVYHAKISTN